MKKATSSGGVIVKLINNIPHVLLIQTHSYDDWYLPKGHVENTESLEETAIREIAEETGITNIKIIHKLGQEERYVESLDEYKTIHYFLVTTPKDSEPKETVDNKDCDLKWFPVDQLPKMYWPNQEKIITDNIELIKNLPYH